MDTLLACKNTVWPDILISVFRILYIRRIARQTLLSHGMVQTLIQVYL